MLVSDACEWPKHYEARADKKRRVNVASNRKSIVPAKGIRAFLGACVSEIGERKRGRRPRAGALTLIGTSSFSRSRGGDEEQSRTVHDAH